MDIHAIVLLAMHCYYDIIWGRDFLCQLTFAIMSLSKHRSYFDDSWRLIDAHMLDKRFDDLFDALATLIEKVKHDYVWTDDIAMAQTHLDNSQCDQLATMLLKFQNSFDGRLKTHPHGRCIWIYCLVLSQNINARIMLLKNTWFFQGGTLTLVWDSRRRWTVWSMPMGVTYFIIKTSWNTCLL